MKSHANMLLEKFGKPIQLQWYFFESAGEEIPLHFHEIFVHASIVIAGEFEVFDDTGKTKKLALYDYVEFATGRKHGLRALAPGSVLLSVREQGIF